VLENVDGNGLELVGLVNHNNKESKAVALLQSILRVQVKRETSLSFSDIYNAFVGEQENASISKAWVHRLLKELVEFRLIEIQGGNSPRNRYFCDINTLGSGLSHMRELSLVDVESKIGKLVKKKEELEVLDTIGLAQTLFESLTGTMKMPTSRFLKGIDEFHRVTDETIYMVAKPGDIIRTSVANVEPFVEGYTERTKRLFVAAANGVEVRYAVPLESFGSESYFGAGMDKEFMEKAMQVIKRGGNKEGPGLHVRINPAAAKSHEFVSLNSEIMALWISEDPPTAAWITRDFNADLIDDITRSFEEQWAKSYSVVDVLEKAIREGAGKREKGAGQ
jgi:hypothetical protein